MPWSDRKGYESLRPDSEWAYLFTDAALAEVLEVQREIIAAAEAAPDSRDLRRDLQRITQARMNAGMRATGSWGDYR